METTPKINWRPVSEWNGDLKGLLCLIELPRGNPFIEITNPTWGSSEGGTVVGFVDLGSMGDAEAALSSLKSKTQQRAQRDE